MQKTTLFLIILLCSTIVRTAQVNASTGQAVNAESSVAGKWCVNVSGSLGASFPWGELRNINSPEAQTSLAYGVGVKSWYGLGRYVAVLGGLGYCRRPVSINYAATGDEYTFLINSIDLLAGVRGSYKNIYAEAGLFAGITPGDCDVKSGSSTVSFDKAYPNGKINNDYGFLLGAGYSVPYSSRVSFDVGVQCRFGVVHVVEIGNDRLGSTEVLFTAGGNYFL